MMLDSRVSIIIINYNGAGIIDRCISSIEDSYGIPHELLVVDNGSTDSSPGYLERLGSKRPFFTLIKAGKNLGFGKAANLAASKASGDILLFLNPDTEVTEHDLSPLINRAKEKDTGIVGPRVLNTDGSLQYSARSFPTLSRQFYESYFLHRLFRKNKVLGSYFMTYWDYNSPRRVDWISGAFMLIEEKKFRDIGGFDEGFFMYSEDTDICYRLDASGLKNYYDPSYGVIHIDSAIASREEGKREARIWESRRKYFKKHYTRYHAVALSLIFFAGIINRVLLFLLPALFSQSSKKKLKGHIDAIRRYFNKDF